MLYGAENKDLLYSRISANSGEVKAIFYITIKTILWFKGSKKAKVLAKICRSPTHFLAEEALSNRRLSWASVPSTVPFLAFRARLLKLWNLTIVEKAFPRSRSLSIHATFSICRYRHFHYVIRIDSSWPVLSNCQQVLYDTHDEW